MEPELVHITKDPLSFSIATIGASYSATWERKPEYLGWCMDAGPSPSTKFVTVGCIGAKGLLEAEASAGGSDCCWSAELPSAGNLLRKRQSHTGTFSIPDRAGPFPAVVLLSGSGHQTRDEELFGHKILLVLADVLNRHGVAVLRYDKRGVGASTCDFETATAIDFASDVDAAVAFLKARREVKQRRVGLIGHSEGGAIAPSVAIRNPAVAFTVLMAGPAMRIDRITILQEELIAKAMGVPADLIAKRKTLNEKLFMGIMSAKTDDEALSLAKILITQAVADKVLPADAADVTVKRVTTPRFRQSLSYDPRLTLLQLKKPVLALNGSLDLQITSKENLALMREALKDNKSVTIQELPNLNHMFQTAKSGSPIEYGQIEETIAPEALKIIVDWVIHRN